MIRSSFKYFRRKGDEPSKTSPKADFHQKRVLHQYRGILKVSSIRDFKANGTIDSNIYCRQLDNLNQSIVQKSPELQIVRE